MDSNRYELEGGIRLSHVRRVKRYLYLAQMLIAVAAAVILVIIGGGLQLKPFFVQITSFLYFVILMILIVSVESFVFQAIEMRFTKSESSKYYMIKKSTRRSLIVIGISILVIVVILTPFLNEIVANYSSEAGRTSTSAIFYNRDPLGFTTTNKIELSSTTPSEVIVVSAAFYNQYQNDPTKLREFAVCSTFNTMGGTEVSFPNAPYGQYYIVVMGSGEVSYHLQRTLTPSFVSYVMLFAIMFLGFFAIWTVYLTRFRVKYSKGAIYR